MKLKEVLGRIESFYNQLATELETAQHYGDYRKFFRLVRVTIGKYSTPVSQCITDKTGHKITDVEARLTRLCEYFEELLNRPEPVTAETENTDTPNHQPYDINDLPPFRTEIATVIQNQKKKRPLKMTAIECVLSGRKNKFQRIGKLHCYCDLYTKKVLKPSAKTIEEFH